MCLKVCGIMPEGGVACDPTADVIDLTRPEASVLPRRSTSDTWPFGHSVNRWEEVFVNGRVVVFTDGACQGNQFRRLRSAGFGAFWGVGHPFNVSEPLQGQEHTNNRAELMAVLRVLELELRPIEIRSDSA